VVVALLKDIVDDIDEERDMAKSYPPRFKFQVVMELLRGERSVGQLAKSYNVHSNSILKWKKELLEKGPALFAQDNASAEYERRIAQLEQLLGRKEVEIALLKNFLGQMG
jgi:transposase-like protein